MNEQQTTVVIDDLDDEYAVLLDRESRRSALCSFCQLSPSERKLDQWDVDDDLDGSSVDYFWCQDCWDREYALRP